MLRFWPSRARAWVKPWIPSFAAEQLTWPKLPKRPAAEAVLTIRPQPCSLMMFQAALEHEQVPVRWTLMMISQSSCFIFWKEMSRRMPALLSRMSTLPKLSIAVLMIFSPNSTESQLATATPPLDLISSTTLSAALLEPPLPETPEPRSLTTTLAPLLAKNSAYSLPSPPPAPVTTTTFPSYLSAMRFIII